MYDMYQLCVLGFSFPYLDFALLFQGSFATTATALNDGLGFKIEFASLVWQPLVNSILVRYLLLHPRTFCMLTALSSTILFCECWSLSNVYILGKSEICK